MLLLLCGVVIFCYVFSRLTRGITKSVTCLVGKTAIVTGANSGLGFQTALNLASRGCRVIMADVADMEESKSNIIKFTSNPNIVTKKLDLASLKSVRDFATDIVKTEKKLDILINNAGILLSAKNRTDDGLHPVIQINYFGHFLLTHLLIDLLKKSAPSRIVFTSSLLAFLNNLSLTNLNYDDAFRYLFFWRDFLPYGNSKLAMIIASDIFAEKLKGTGVTSNSLYPGCVATQIFATSFAERKSFVALLLRFLVFLFGKDAWEGSQILVHLAVAKELENTTGKFFVDCVSFFKPWSAYNRKWCREIWEASERYVGLQKSVLVNKY